MRASNPNRITQELPIVDGCYAAAFCEDGFTVETRVGGCFDGAPAVNDNYQIENKRATRPIFCDELTSTQELCAIE